MVTIFQKSYPIMFRNNTPIDKIEKFIFSGYETITLIS